MRIIAGKYRGTRLTPVGKGDVSAHLRPTTDRVRESLFNVLNGHVAWDSCHVLDVFAGTGALGLEALSRGAASVTFVESGRAGQRLIEGNIAKLRADAVSRLLRQDATRLGAATGQYDVVFLDPPYGKGLGERAIGRLLSGGWLAAHALIVWEEIAPQDAPDGFELLDQRRYGGTHVTLLETN